MEAVVNPGRIPEIQNGRFLPEKDRDRYLERFRAATCRLENGGGCILVAEPDPVDFAGAALAGILAGRSLVFGNPGWESAEWEVLFNQVRVDTFFGDVPDAGFGDATDDLPEPAAGEILVPTGGTTGSLKLARHRWETFRCAAAGLHAYFGLGPLNSVCSLPLWHVSGWMQVMRALISEGEVAFVPWKSIHSGSTPDWSPEPPPFLSLVPSQLERLLRDHPDPWNFLRAFRGIFIGGARWHNQKLSDRCREEAVPLIFCYGMTETAAMVTLQTPSDFFRGGEGVGKPLPHAAVRLADAFAVDAPAPIEIRTPALFGGYWGMENIPAGSWFQTQDLGMLDSHGLQVVGRADRTVITGGENVDPAEVERVILDHPDIQDAVVFGIEDASWGQRVVAVLVAAEGAGEDSEEAVVSYLRERLVTFKVPKAVSWVPEIPRTGAGKPDLCTLTACFSRSPD